MRGLVLLDEPGLIRCAFQCTVVDLCEANLPDPVAAAAVLKVWSDSLNHSGCYGCTAATDRSQLSCCGNQSVLKTLTGQRQLMQHLKSLSAQPCKGQEEMWRKGLRRWACSTANSWQHPAQHTTSTEGNLVRCSSEQHQQAERRLISSEPCVCPCHNHLWCRSGVSQSSCSAKPAATPTCWGYSDIATRPQK